MRTIKQIIVHCSATYPGQHCDARVIDSWHRQRGWDGIGYHFVILPDGDIEYGRPISMIGAHVKGKNQFSIGICYIGGLDDTGKPKDTRTIEQRISIEAMVAGLYSAFPLAEVTGHRDLTHDRDCPCFDVPNWWASLKHAQLVNGLFPGFGA
jgi:N-acetylmuramoyl-L-alanine amidase